VILNLLGNAIKYTNEGFVKLHMESVPAGEPSRVELRIGVVDTGIGIPAEILESIFEEFTQADGSVTRLYGGTGLGLAIAKRLVQMQGGRIWAESEVGGGSTFHVSIEFEVGQAPREPAGSAAAETDDAETPVRGRILVVEDNTINQQVVEGLLTRRGYEVRVVNHGGEALAVMEGSSFDLVLMDVQMPVLDGLETTQRIRRDPRWRDLPIVGLTAHTMTGDRARCIAAGMNDYLPKPVRSAALLGTVNRFLSAPKPVAG
jgi:CheY-like chemotaxis protein